MGNIRRGLYAAGPPVALMICPSCGQETVSSPGQRFCTNCGTPLVSETDQPQQPLPGEPLPGEEAAEAAAPRETGASSQDRMLFLETTVSALWAQQARLGERLSAIERRLGLPAGGQPARSRPQPAPPSSAAPSAPSSHPAAARVWDTIVGWNWEWLVGGNWMARIGIAALVIGVGFFLKLAIDNDWIGETGRVALGLVAGVALLAGGDYWRKKYPLWAQPLTGGGIAILFLSIFAAFALYDLIPTLVAFALFFLVTLTATGLALRYESMAIAILGIIGGFLTPVLLLAETSGPGLNGKLPDSRLLLAYVLVLDLGVLGLATFRNWRWFTLLGLLGSLGLFWLWLDELNPELLLSQLGLTFIFLIFMGATTLFHILWRRIPGPADLGLMVLNAWAYFGISYGLLFQELRPWIGGFTLLLALMYGLLGYGIAARGREVVYLSYFALGIAVVFLTIAIPVQLGGPWISVAWAVEGVVLIWLSFTLRMYQLRYFGVAVFAAFAAWLLSIDTPEALETISWPSLNVYLPTYALDIALTFLAAYMIYRNKQLLEPWENWLFPTFLVAGSLVLTVAVGTQVQGPWLAVAWAVEGVALIWLSFRLGLRELRWSGLGVLATMAIRLLAFDTLDYELQTFRPVANLRFLSFAVGIAAIYLGVFFLWRWRERILDTEARVVLPVLLVGASFLSLWILSAEVLTSVDSELFNVASHVANNVKSLSLSILWAIYAAVLVVLGILRQWRWVRLGGLALLAVPVLKLFLVDSFALEQGYRVGAFVGLGALLVAGGFLYQRYSRIIRGFLFE